MRIYICVGRELFVVVLKQRWMSTKSRNNPSADLKNSLCANVSDGQLSVCSNRRKENEPPRYVFDHQIEIVVFIVVVLNFSNDRYTADNSSRTHQRVFLYKGVKWSWLGGVYFRCETTTRTKGAPWAINCAIRRA